MSIKIGDNNRIKNCNINDGSDYGEKKGWTERHPIITDVLISLVVGFLLLFSFWKDVVKFLEGIF